MSDEHKGLARWQIKKIQADAIEMMLIHLATAPFNRASVRVYIKQLRKESKL